MDLVFYMNDESVCSSLAPFFWVGDIKSLPLNASEGVDLYSFMFSAVPQNAILHLSSGLLSASYAWFPQFYDQRIRWSLDRRVNMDRALQEFPAEVASQAYFLRQNRISRVIFDANPHRARDFLCLKVAQHFGLQTAILETINLGYRSYFRPDCAGNLLDATPQPSKLTSSGLDSTLASVRTDHLPAPADAIGKVMGITPAKVLARLMDLSGEIPRDYVAAKSRWLPHRLFLLGWFFTRAWFQRLTHILWWSLNSKKLRVESEDIVFYGHYFPEQTLNPRAFPFFSNQLTPVAILGGLKRRVFYKEHPYALQLGNPYRNRTGTDGAHRKLLKKSGAKLLRGSPPGRHIVATLNGTVGIEKALEGFRVICFGSAWYDFLPNVHRFESSEGLVNFLETDLPSTKEIRKQLSEAVSYYSVDARLRPEYLTHLNPNSSEIANMLSSLQGT